MLSGSEIMQIIVGRGVGWCDFQSCLNFHLAYLTPYLIMCYVFIGVLSVEVELVIFSVVFILF